MGYEVKEAYYCRCRGLTDHLGGIQFVEGGRSLAGYEVVEVYDYLIQALMWMYDSQS